MKIDIKYQGNIINLPSTVANFVEKATKNDLAVIIGLSTDFSRLCGFEHHIADFAKNLGMSVDEVRKSLSFWQKCGIISADKAEDMDNITDKPALPNDLPSYTGEQIARFVEENKKVGTLFDNCQAVLKKTFSKNDFNNVIYLKDFYGFDDEYILLLLAHCNEVEKTTWSYIRKTASALYDDGIDTYAKLEAHFYDRKNKRSLEYKIRKIFGIGEREFSKSEKDVVGKWISMKINPDLLKMAYDITIDKTSKPSIKYAAKIIDNWLVDGITTPDMATEAENRRIESKKSSSFDTDDFFEAALRRSYGDKKDMRREKNELSEKKC